jgi:pyruvate dehydrogenase E2 component (dihydrolipoamide acetyltransferase)
MPDIVMPRLSDTMEEGTILRWLKRDGEQVRRGEELVEIETDKASMTYESDQDGSLEVVAREGDTLPIGAVIAHVSPADGAAPTPRAAPATASEQPAADVSFPREAPVVQAPATAPPGATERLKASPLARRVARERGIALEQLAGSGPGGRIVKADVEAAPRAAAPAPPDRSEAPQAARAPVGPPAAEARVGPPPAEARVGPPAAEAPAGAPTVAAVMRAKGDARTSELSRTQQAIARRMAESKATIPHFVLEAEIDMEGCVGLRSELARHTDGPPPTYNDMVVKASALALRAHPRANASYRDGQLTLYGRINVGVAVAIDGEDPLASALVVPTVFDADAKSLGEIARTTRTLAERVRAGTITPPELSGGTFTVSNLGMYGIRAFTAIINPPQAAILAVGALAPRPVVRDGEIQARHTMAVTLACDHRMLYGADAARLLGRIRELLEEPAALTL